MYRSLFEVDHNNLVTLCLSRSVIYKVVPVHAVHERPVAGFSTECVVSWEFTGSQCSFMSTSMICQFPSVAMNQHTPSGNILHSL